MQPPLRENLGGGLVNMYIRKRHDKGAESPPRKANEKQHQIALY